MGEFGSEKNYPKLRGPSSKPLLGGENVGPDGADGTDAVFVVAQANNILVPSDFDGGNPVLTNAITEFEIWQGNTLLATKSSLDGWTSQVVGTNGVSIDDSTDLEATVTVITVDEGDFTMQFDKVGFTSVTAKIYVKKMRQGEKGDTGDTGTTGGVGPTGAQGITGADGTGLVIVKKEISMMNYSFYLVSGTNSGGLIFTSNANHELVVGDTVHHYNFPTQTSYNGDFKVVEVGSPTTYRVEAGPIYIADDGGSGYSISAIRDINNSQPQDLAWFDMVPVGTGLIEFRLLMVTEDNEDEVYAYLGYHENPTVGWNFYMNGELFEEEGDQKAYPAFGQPYLLNSFTGISNPSAQRKDIWLRLTPYSGKNWTTYYQAVKFNLFAAYINHSPDTLGT